MDEVKEYIDFSDNEEFRRELKDMSEMGEHFIQLGEKRQKAAMQKELEAAKAAMQIELEETKAAMQKKLDDAARKAEESEKPESRTDRSLLRKILEVISTD